MKNFSQKLVLGTVQFGLDYGINNFAGQPAKEDSLKMLDYAWQNGIRTFDTAYAYGNAEEILGEFLQSRDLGSEAQIITKLKPNIISESEGEACDIISANLQASLGRLKRDYVDGYLLHTPGYIREEKIVSALIDLKRQGLVKNIGVSIYEEEDALYAAKLDKVDYIQIPYSIFDQRLNKTDFFQLAKKNKKTVFARSAFLQGLFFMEENKIPSYIENAKVYFREMDRIIEKYGFSRQQAALMFSLKNKDIDHTVFGVDNVGQLREDIAIAESEIEFEDCLAELKEKFVNIEKNIIFPSLWKK
jgi:aryl-alcohol dehydrogenase-like predicted oxidoreductase